MKIHLLTSIVVCAMASGCLHNGPAAVSSSTTANSASPDPTQTTIDGPTAGPEPRIGLNLTACRGGSAALGLPVSVISEQVPKIYTIAETAPGVSHISLTAATCSKLAVNGTDTGPAGLAFVWVPVKIPASSKAPAGMIGQFLIETRATPGPLLTWWSWHKMKLKTEGVDYSLTSLDAYQDQLHVVVRGGTENTYDFSAAMANASSTIDYNLRSFIGPDPAKDFVDLHQRGTRSNSQQPGPFRWSAETPQAKALQGAPGRDGFIDVFPSVSFEVTSPN